MEGQEARLARALTDATRAINTTQTLEETLDAILAAALTSIPGFNHAGISMTHRGGTVETVAGTDQLVWELDTLQYEHGEGPCLDAIRDGGVVLVENARHEQRWPTFMPLAVAAGLRAQMGLSLFTEDESVGGLNLYSTEADTVDADARDIAELFATHAAIALGRTRREQHLSDALLSRQLIGQAVGITMERYQIDADRAFHFLVRASQTSNIKVRDLAEEVVRTALERYDHGSPARH